MVENHSGKRDFRAGLGRFVSLGPLVGLLLLCAQVRAQVPAEPPEPVGRILVAEVEFRGNTVLSREVLLEAVGIRPGDTVTHPQLGEASVRIERAYAERGYEAAVPTYEVIGEPPGRTIVFNIIETRVAEVRITGLERTQESVVRRVLGIRAGDVTSEEDIRQAVTRLRQLGVFEAAGARVQPGERPGEIILLIDVREVERTRRIDVGGTFSPQDRLTAEVAYTDLNLFGRAQILRVAVNAGSIAGRIGGRVTYVNPVVGRPEVSLVANVFSDVIYRFSDDLVGGEDLYFERRTGVQGLLSRRIDLAQTLSYGLRYVNTRVENLPEQLLLPDAIITDGNVLFGSARYVRDDRIFIFTPVRGGYFSSTAEAGVVDGDAGGTNAVGKISAERRWYIPLERIDEEELARDIPQRVVAVRFSGGTSVGDLPFFEQYFVGGIFNLRGYREGRFWGPNYLFLNTELRWPISRRLVGLAFVDVGDAWNSRFQFQEDVETAFRQHEDFSPRAGAGLGLWYLTEVGIVRLEYARGEDDRLHFAVGQTF